MRLDCSTRCCDVEGPREKRIHERQGCWLLVRWGGTVGGTEHATDGTRTEAERREIARSGRSDAMDRGARAVGWDAACANAERNVVGMK